MNSDRDTRCRVGCPIRRPRDHRSLASPPGFSQRATSFIASQCQGIHQMPFFACSPVSPTEETAPPPRTGSNPAFAGAGSHAPAVSHEDTSRTDPVLEQRGPVRLGHIINALFTLQSTPAPLARGACFVLPRTPRPTADGASRRRSAEPGGWRSQSFDGGGGERTRTDDLLLAKQALSQLSYTPVQKTDARTQNSRISAVLISAFCHLNGGPGRI